MPMVCRWSSRRTPRRTSPGPLGRSSSTARRFGTPLPQLSRWYDLDFRLADSSLGAIPLSGRLDQTLTPDRLDLLAGSVGLEQVRRGRMVTFYRMGGAPR